MKKSLRLPNGEEQAILDGVQVRLVERSEVERFNRLLDEHHYVGSLHAVGERLQYVATDRGESGWHYWSSVQQPSTSSTGTNGSDGAAHNGTVV